MKKKFNFKISVWQYLALGYLALIIVGCLSLLLPFAAKDGTSTNFIDALFTAVSATCVTGLSPLNVGAHWSMFGQIVILILIQLGGLGFMTFVSMVFRLLRGRVGVYERKAFMASAGSEKYIGLGKLIRRIFIGTAVFEVLGAILLSIRFVGDFGWGTGIYFAIFHSISAFCNAGFDLFGQVGQSSLTAYITDPLVILTISALITVGGLGFCVWGDIADCKCNPKKFQLNTKIVLIVSTILYVLSVCLFLIFEWNNTDYADYHFGEKLLAALFCTVAPRTAGFYSTNLVNLSESGYVLTIILMFIGGNSGSTAGGIKVGTFAVIIMGMLAVFRGRRDINMGKKRIEHTLLSQALAIFAACLMMVMLASLMICAFEPEESSKSVLFECVSALSTTGLRLNLTPKLGVASKIVLILLMYAGRVGILTLALALGEKHVAAEVRKPIDKLLIG